MRILSPSREESQWTASPWTWMECAPDPAVLVDPADTVDVVTTHCDLPQPAREQAAATAGATAGATTATRSAARAVGDRVDLLVRGYWGAAQDGAADHRAGPTYSASAAAAACSPPP